MGNSVAKTTEQYDKHKKLWEKCRDAIEGQEAIKEKDVEYLPKLSGQSTDDYKKYKGQAMFYNATGRTFKAYKGLISRKDPDVNAEAIQEFVDDCTLSGKPLIEFSEEATAEEIAVSRFGILVDHPNQGGSNLSQAEAEQRGNRPYFVAYLAEDIRKVTTKRIGSRTVLWQVILHEKAPVETSDEFKDEEVEQFRVLDLDPDRDFAYRQRVFREIKEDTDQWEEVQELTEYPRMNGSTIKEIPFYMVGGYEYRTPHMLDLVNVNLSHYVAYADHRRGVSFTTRPQAYGTGISDDDLDAELVIGNGDFWNFPRPEAELGMLEYTGAGLSASENLLKDLKEDMANLGARMLMPDVGGEADTATEFVIKKQGENSALGGVSKVVGDCLTKSIKFAARWMGVNEEEISIKLNTDFIPFQATPDDLVKMINAVQSGEYLKDDYLWWARQNEMVDPTIPDEERKAALETNRPAGM